jgi:hypothetical protein
MQLLTHFSAMGCKKDKRLSNRFRENHTMLNRFSLHNSGRRGQFMYQYTIIITLICAGLIVGGIYAIRSWNANIKGWEESIQDSHEDQLVFLNSEAYNLDAYESLGRGVNMRLGSDPLPPGTPACQTDGTCSAAPTQGGSCIYNYGTDNCGNPCVRTNRNPSVDCCETITFLCLF